MEDLLKIGFLTVGTWSLINNELKVNLDSFQRESNLLYCFVSNGSVKYVGKTKNNLEQRMYGYQKPGPSQSTNQRVNDKIRQCLRDNQKVDILILIDNGGLRYGHLKINLAAGLEDTLIDEFKPDWNLHGNKSSLKNALNYSLSESKSYEGDLKSPKVKIDLVLRQTYFEQGFFNIRNSDSEYFANHNSPIEIKLGLTGDKIIKGLINRTANINGSPRIMGGKELKNWFNSNFKPNELFVLEIISPVSIWLYKS